MNQDVFFLLTWFYNEHECRNWSTTKKNHRIALCCYPNINSAIRNLGLNTPTAPIFLQFNYFRENIWVIIWVQFHFLYIFVGRVDRIHKTSHITMLSFYFSLQTSKVLGTSWTVLPKRRLEIFELIKIEANIWIFQIAFCSWIAPLTKKSFSGLF